MDTEEKFRIINTYAYCLLDSFISNDKREQRARIVFGIRGLWGVGETAYEAVDNLYDALAEFIQYDIGRII